MNTWEFFVNGVSVLITSEFNCGSKYVVMSVSWEWLRRSRNGARAILLLVRGGDGFREMQRVFTANHAHWNRSLWSLSSNSGYAIEADSYADWKREICNWRIDSISMGRYFVHNSMWYIGMKLNELGIVSMYGFQKLDSPFSRSISRDRAMAVCSEILLLLLVVLGKRSLVNKRFLGTWMIVSCMLM